ncbi:MAG TPA: DNA mismatch repair protein MutS [Balneola sp.]|nr:DNA mismatch repair protein MutS [Balneola sp.]MAO77817.1 DNA mismatch repair protein MutS [Balneola sp.]MBF63271.1 DNA mismatch repair protein MutS [Balneola sp.]HBZ37867.1 DNA mismatch repair protein MutS [Balneola sp.]|tara:strand:+ start:121159 stop:123828 length:2670 start_codon:yes stop_codon:yes gene_type:complete
MAAKKQTPLMKQYFEIKDEHPGTILLFRVGDFYETFSDDAVLVSKELGITLTKRNNGGDQTPLAGFPFHSLDSYLPKLVKKGYKVAVCDQTESPDEAKKAGRKIVTREVTEITTPGVTLSEKLLEHKRNNYIVSLHWTKDRVGVAFSDISTGEFGLSEVSERQLDSLLAAIQPSEVLVSSKLKNKLEDAFLKFNITYIEDWVYEGDYGYKILTEHFEVHSLKGFGVEELKTAHVAAGSLMHYMQETQKAYLRHLRRLYAYESNEYMSLDPATKRNLELTASIQDGNVEGTLISIMDKTCTAMGGRLLRRWIMRPLKRLKPIQQRLDSVEIFYSKHDVRSQLREELEQVGDLERLISRICVGRTNARDIVQLKLSLAQIPVIKSQFAGFDDPLLKDISGRLKLLIDLQEHITKTLAEEPTASIRDGNMIRDGFNEELDELRDIAKNGKKYIAQIKDKLAKDSGIASLKIGYNKVFGYYIEVTNSHKDKVPEHFIRKQTLVNAERYITPELKEIEEKILSAEERSKTLEYELFEEVRLYVSEFADDIQQIAFALAELDCIQCFAEVAFKNNYAKPEVRDSEEISIKKGRHPVVEETLPMGEPFIPNDIELNNSDQQIMIITGPNMAGKSIILRQTGLIVLLAQVGSFVPAESATIGMVDKIFTRVGASDNLAAGESTFLVEMNEAANILNNATPRSLILLDEVGRGTSTFDGLSIAWSLAEYLHNHGPVAAKTLFATHYHELNELEQMYDRTKNFNVQVKEHDGKVIFLRKLVRGGADHSYGIQVANMAGLPQIVIDRAKDILKNLESHSLDITNKNGSLEGKASAQKDAAKNLSDKIEKQDEIEQMNLFATHVDPRLETVLNKLEASDPNRMTPIEALMMITELKKIVDR